MRSTSLNRRRRLLLLGATAIAALLVVGLPAGGAAAGKGERQTHRRSRAVRVDISEFAFHPHTLHIARGTKVVFANEDSTAHTATRSGSFETGHIRPGHSVTVELKRAGVYAYHCSIHSFMHGKIVVR